MEFPYPFFLTTQYIMDNKKEVIAVGIILFFFAFFLWLIGAFEDSDTRSNFSAGTQESLYHHPNPIFNKIIRESQKIQRKARLRGPARESYLIKSGVPADPYVVRAQSHRPGPQALTTRIYQLLALKGVDPNMPI